jgi:glycosyltransferase involved in cell wall biosynthesis
MPGKRVLFAHDGPLEVSPEGVPMGVHYTDTLLQRYFQLGSKLTFLMRAKPVLASETSSYSPLVRPGFSFQSVINVKTPIKYVLHARSALKSVRRAVSEHDVIVVRLPSVIGSWAFQEARRQHKPVLVEFVSCTWDSLWNYGLLGKVTAPYFFFKNRILMQYSSYSIYVTEHFLQVRYPSRGKSIACSNVELTASGEDVLEQRLKRISCCDHERAIILTTIAAVDVPYKDQAAVIRSLALMGKAGDSYKYRIVGQGDPGRLKKLAQDLGVLNLIEFYGPVPHADIAAVLDDTDIYIQPSRQEGLPRALIEAMSRGCPALGSNTGGIPELLPVNRIFAKGDIKRLVELIRSYSSSLMIFDAAENWKTAQKYDKKILASRRASFFTEFLSDIN